MTAMGSMLAAVATTSLAGSVHCAAMCGPLIGLYHDPQAPRIAPHVAHALGRAGAYVTLGAIAGAVGGAVDLAGGLAHVQRIAWVIAAATITAWGVVTLLRALGLVARGAAGATAFGRALVQIKRRRPTTRAALVGLLSASLPCGWLWAFVVLAAGTGGPIAGALVMLAFWSGTVPMMLGAGVVITPIARRLGSKWPLVSAALLIALGTFALVVRAPIAPPHADAPHAGAAVIPSGPTCHGL